MEELNLDEMRSQIAILKTKLDKQEIINDRMMHEVINSKANSMKNKMIANIICGLFVIFIAPFAFHMRGGISWTFVIATDIFMFYGMIREYLFKRQLNDKILMNASLLDVAKKMKAFKTSYKIHNFTSMLLLLIWVIWLFVEAINSNPQTKYIIIPCMIVGGVIGTLIGIWIYLRIQNAASDIIRQIEE